MLKNKYIALILLALVCITLYNLYYKPHISEASMVMQWYRKLVDPIQQINCPLEGFQCPFNKPCDCQEYCLNGQSFVSFQVLEDADNRSEAVYVMNRKLTPGHYCLPKGIGQCNLKTSYHVFSLAGWSCFSHNQSIFKGDKKRACKNEEAADPNANILWDHLLNQEAGDNITDYYELHNGKLRYECQCGSLSLDGTRMVSIVPFTCVTDYCLRDIKNPPSFMGWEDNECKCGPYPHEDDNDKTSPCKTAFTEVENNVLKGRVDCMTDKSYVYRPLYCPTSDNVLTFNEFIYPGGDEKMFVKVLTENFINWETVTEFTATPQSITPYIPSPTIDALIRNLLTNQFNYP